MAEIYDVLHKIKPILDDNRGKIELKVFCWIEKLKKQYIVLGDYEIKASHTYYLGWEPNAQSEIWEPSGAIIIQTGENEFYYAGFGVSLTFKNLKKSKARVGILKTDCDYFKDGKWTVFQHLNGDQTHQGRHIRSFVDDVSIQRFKLYEYE